MRLLKSIEAGQRAIEWVRSKNPSAYKTPHVPGLTADQELKQRTEALKRGIQILGRM